MSSLQLLGKLAGSRCALRIFSNGSSGGVGGTTQLAALINFPVNSQQPKTFIHTQNWDNSPVDRDTNKESADQRRKWSSGALVPVRNASSSAGKLIKL